MKTTQDVANCGDEDHCQYHLGIHHCHTGNKYCKHPLTCFRTIFADLLVHTVKLKPIIKDQIPGKLVTSGISDVAIASKKKKPGRRSGL